MLTANELQLPLYNFYKFIGYFFRQKSFSHQAGTLFSCYLVKLHMKEILHNFNFLGTTSEKRQLGVDLEYTKYQREYNSIWPTSFIFQFYVLFCRQVTHCSFKFTELLRILTSQAFANRWLIFCYSDCLNFYTANRFLRLSRFCYARFHKSQTVRLFSACLLFYCNAFWYSQPCISSTLSLWAESKIEKSLCSRL